MKITFPHMGTAYIPFRALIQGVGYHAVVPPRCTQKTLALGTRHAPESACLPLKINIGNYLEAQQQGAEGILMAGGIGPCRFGFYGTVQKEILQDIGIALEMLIIEPPQQGWPAFINQLSYLTRKVTKGEIAQTLALTWAKFTACDRLEKESLKTRAYEATLGDTSRVLHHSLELVDQASSLQMVRQAVRTGLTSFKAVAKDLDREVLTVGVVGEIYTLLEPFANFYLEERLGELGVIVQRQVWFSEWILHHIVLSAFKKRRNGNLLRLAKPYLTHFVGGHGLETVAHTAAMAKTGADGIIHILPFTCMPEIVAQSILPEVSRDYQIPVLTLVVDEHSAEAGIHTRLEAFVDLLHNHKRAFQKASKGVETFGKKEMYPIA